MVTYYICENCNSVRVSFASILGTALPPGVPKYKPKNIETPKDKVYIGEKCGSYSNMRKADFDQPQNKLNDIFKIFLILLILI